MYVIICIDACPSGEELRGGVCLECSRGSYRTANLHAACQTCRRGFTTLSFGSASVADCVRK